MRQKTLLGAMLVLHCTIALHAMGQAAYINKVGDTFKPADLVCDTRNTIVTVEDGAYGNPVYISWNKPNLSPGVLLTDAVDSPDCGAGSCYYTWTSGSYTYRVRRSQVLDEVNSLFGGRVTVTNGSTSVYDQSCRTPARAVVQCVTQARTIYVIKNSNGTYSYRSFDYKSQNPAVPSLSINGGTGSIGAYSGLATYSFQNGTYQYTVLTDPFDPAAASGYARVIVRNGSSILLDQTCDAYSLGIGAL